MPIKRIGIIWKDVLSVNMFTDFLRTIYLRDRRLHMVSYSLFNTPDIVAEQLGTLGSIEKEGLFPLVLIKSTEVLNPENLALKATIEGLDQVIVLKQKDFPNPDILKGAEELAPVVERWKVNLERMAAYR